MIRIVQTGKNCFYGRGAKMRSAEVIVLITKQNSKSFMKDQQVAAEMSRQSSSGNEQSREENACEEAKIIRVSRGEVRPKLDVQHCALCGRTILTGEVTELYNAPQADDHPMIVCSICRPKARDNGLSKVA